VEQIGLIILFASVVYVYVSKTYTYSIVIFTSLVLNKKQKFLHCILVWLIPFLWFYMFKDNYSNTNNTMTKDIRDKMNAKLGGFTESNTGIN